MLVSLSEFLAKSDEYVYKLADNLLDAMTNGEHSKSLKEPEPVSPYCNVLTDPRQISFTIHYNNTGWNVRASIYWVSNFLLFLPVQQVEEQAKMKDDKDDMEVRKWTHLSHQCCPWW